MKKFSLKSKTLFLCGIIVATFIVCVLLISLLFPYKYDKEITAASTRYDLSPDFVRAVIWAESRFKPDSVSSKGAVGLMQLLPSTANWLYGTEIDVGSLKNIDLNLDLGCKYLRYLIDKFGKKEMALAAYNAGEGNVEHWIENKRADDIPFEETKKYIKRVKVAEEIYDFKDLFMGMIFRNGRYR